MDSSGTKDQRANSVPPEPPIGTIKQENAKFGTIGISELKPLAVMNRNATALTTSKLLNQACPKEEEIPQDTERPPDTFCMESILARLNEQQAVLARQTEALKSTEDESVPRRHLDTGSSSNSLPITPATDTFQATAPTTRPGSAAVTESQKTNDEVLHLKLQLAQAHTQITQLEEMAQTRSGPPEPTQHVLNTVRNVPAFARENPWQNSPIDDSHSDAGDSASTSGLSRARGIWAGYRNASTVNFPASRPFMNHDLASADWTTNRGGMGSLGIKATSSEPAGGYPPMEGYRPERLTPDTDMFMRRHVGQGSNRYDNRTQGANGPFSTGYGGAFSSHGAHLGQTMSVPGSPMHAPQIGTSMGMHMYPGGLQDTAATSLSPHASEFTSKAGWKDEASTLGVSSEGSTYLPPTEPLNYRRLLDRNVNCNWKYIVDKIVCSNDQQASIFLQQKLKVGTPEQKYEIVEAIVEQCYALMVNRFGNFLVQRCFEHGTPEQVIKIAEGIRGHTLALSMDPFGCHVVQKAFDSVPENYKAIMVHELLRRIPETVIHRYACHVWQKLFELRWTETPPQIMKYVNEALQGMWHEVALGETGSLVVQNIFENCLEDDKRPCIEEVLANIDIVAHGQFGNWCIQHICEHGGPPDRSRAIDHVIRYAAEYSTDQFASKVVEKCLKISGQEFLGRYLDRVCEGRRDRTRIPLIDIASDQYGNYLVQWILNNATAQHREIVAAHIRKHMVSLRGSKFGSRVGMLCTNHAVATRPGPGVGPGMGGRIGPGSGPGPGSSPGPGPRYAGAYR